MGRCGAYLEGGEKKELLLHCIVVAVCPFKYDNNADVITATNTINGYDTTYIRQRYCVSAKKILLARVVAARIF